MDSYDAQTLCDWFWGFAGVQAEHLDGERCELALDPGPLRPPGDVLGPRERQADRLGGHSLSDVGPLVRPGCGCRVRPPRGVRRACLAWPSSTERSSRGAFGPRVENTSFLHRRRAAGFSLAR